MSPLLPLVAITALLGGCVANDCTNVEITRKTSPDGRWAAVLFQRDCGATTGFSTQISVIRTDATAKGAGNVFAADDDDGSVRAAAWDGPWAETVWLADDRLIVRHDARSRIFKQESEVAGVRILYEPLRR